MKNILIIGAIAAGVFVLFRGAGGAARLSNGLYATPQGAAFVVAPRPAGAWELAAGGGTVNLANSGQVIYPASLMDLAIGSAWQGEGFEAWQ